MSDYDLNRTVKIIMNTIKIYKRPFCYHKSLICLLQTQLNNSKTVVRSVAMISKNILLEDEQLLMYYDIAKDKV